ncbi:MAG: UDP-3-O-(3-hydroxymyristoyl)glucosamine N-acyltransferase [Bacteroidales bacterium]|nr:UDP-3-O-(3-hydroxymyristoyl)glucosamine N-acyltransferase [Bacteroidales bacterium]
MKFTARQIADQLNGVIEGSPDITVHTVCRIEEGTPGALTFLSNPKYQPYVYQTKASVILVSKKAVFTGAITPTLIRVDDPYQALAKLLTLVEKQPDRKGLEEMSYIHPEAELGDGVYVGAFAYIGKGVKIGNRVKIFPHVYISDDVVIGDDTHIYSGVKIHHQSHIGNHCILHSGVVIGGDGFGFAPGSGMNYSKIPQIGNVILEDHVEVGSNTTIDRATIGSTIIHQGVKLDNLIQVAHNVEIGANTVIAAQTGISGSTKIGKNCMIGGQVGIVGHLTIADGTRIAAQSGVGSSITRKGTTVQGSPAFDVIPYQKSYVVYRNLPAMLKRLEKLENMKLQKRGDG